MSKIEAKLAELGVTLPVAPKPVASYVPGIRTGNLVITSGQLPTKDGQMVATGIVPQEVTPEVAAEAARLCAINNLAVIKAVIGDLDKVVRVVRLGVFVASAPTFTAHPKIANGASDFIQAVFGDAGRHARSTVGMACLPLNAPVEVEMMVEVKD
ncbi:MAG TPA: RidA family protein [Candidatus Sumerlaeota bacterium]|nr:RidA family protein [Candidatus Sumerlaeota bacterium]HMX61793.1 RidA family protein [Candidatus Sumerlaeota bacterium]